MVRTLAMASALALLSLLPTLARAQDGSLLSREETAELFEKQIRPILLQRCAECHSGSTPDGDLDLSSKTGFESGGTSGELIDGTDLEFSLLYARLITPDEDSVMPPDDRLSDEEIAAVRRWIEAGSVWPDETAAISGGESSAQENHWAFRPITRPPVPVVNNERWCWNEVDRFVLAKLEGAGIAPVADADQATWRRRVNIDVTGLPPLPELESGTSTKKEKTANPRANELREINRLLASRAYAERQGRHWLDLARYADTSGDGTDTPIPEARFYRDWVIDAFDIDMPYDQFLIEQIAGDLLAKQDPSDQEAYRKIIATGYIALSRRFGNSKFAEMHQIIDDTIDTIGKSTMGLSIGCARCHHHKFDPITTEDYYGLYGYFSSTQYPHAGTEHQKERSDMPAIQVPPQRAGEIESSVAWAVSDKSDPSDAKIHVAGDPHRQGEVVPRAFLHFLSPDAAEIPANSSGRLELARWIASPQNPLTARVMVNRIWQSHFGRGLVENASNFGRQTSPPIHLALLDFLASEFIDSGWSIKHVHRLILTSHLYRLSSQTSSEQLAVDEANQLWWHFPRVRMEAETLRDCVLAVSGRLEPGSGGRHPFKPTEQIQYNQGHPFDEIFDHQRRSIYLMTPRLNRHPMIALFDGADANVTTASRSESTVPLQSLFFLNSSFIAEQSLALAQLMLAQHDETSTRIDRIWNRVLARSPSDHERQSAVEYIRQYRDARLDEGCEQTQAEQDAWMSVARSLLASNEFIYID